MTRMLHPAFADPVRDSQIVFRAILNAMAMPGRIQTIAAPLSPPAPFDRATAAVVLTLVDNETPVWMDEHSVGLREWVAFHCGAYFSASIKAQFAIALGFPSLGDFRSGSDEEPEKSTTLILQIAAIGQGQAFRLEGPGLQRPSIVSLCGLDGGFWVAWQANHRLFPRGVDIILCAGDHIAALPRTTKMEPA